MISVYPSKLNGQPFETYQVIGTWTLDSWLSEHVTNYSEATRSNASATINGRKVNHENWDSETFGPNDDVRIYPEPKGAELIIAAVTLGAAFSFVAGLITPSLPGTPKKQNTQGDDLSLARVKGNKASLNSPIREIFGKRRIYPDYLLPPHRYFAAPREQVVELLLCVGQGEFDIPLTKINIGDTPVVSLGDDADVKIFQPNSDLSSESESSWWHSAPEVGNTSSGTAGLELTFTSTIESEADANIFVFSGSNVSIPSGAGSFPDTWESGMIIRIEVEYPYTIIDGSPDTISGDIEQLALDVDDLIEITGDNSGLYTVGAIIGSPPTEMTLKYRNGSSVSDLPAGDAQMCIGFEGLRYRIISISSGNVSVERLTNTGSVDLDWPGFSTLSSTTASIKLDLSNLEGGWSGPFAACPEGEVTSKLELDFFYPEGVILITNEGKKKPQQVIVDIDYRDVTTAGSWTRVVNNVVNRTVDQFGKTVAIDLPFAMRPEVRCRKRAYPGYERELGTRDKVQWYGLKSKLQSPSSYEGVTTMTIKVVGGDRIASQSESLVSAEVTRKLPVRVNGVEQGVQPTRNPASAVRYIAKSVGYSDSDIDLSELDRLAGIWELRGDWFDNSVDSSTTVKQAIADAMVPGFAELTISDGRLKPVRDEPRTVFEHMYTPQNMTSALRRSFTTPTADDFDGVDVEYMDDVSWQWETVQCRLPGDLGIRVDKMRLPGVTNRTRAWRIGMRQRRAHQYRRKTFQFSTEMDALNSEYLSYCALADDVPGYGQSAIMEEYIAGIESSRIVSSEPFIWTQGENHVVAVRRLDGTLSGPYSATRVDDYTLDIVGQLDFMPDLTLVNEPPHLLFGAVTRWSYPVLVTSISPSGDSTVDVGAVNYDARVYADDDKAP